jgi:trehalose 6-phosphate phosphatase
VSPEEAMDRLVAAGSRAGLYIDFDGTLAPIVPDPTAARMPPELAPVLADLSGALGLLAVVSGRPAGFLAEHVTVPGVRLLGLYGLEEWVDGRALVRAEAAEWAPVVREAVAELAAATAGDGIYVEDKGLSVALHWRNADDRDESGRQVALLVEAVTARTGLVIEPGKLVAELRPPVDWDKGATVRALAAEAGLSTGVYVGDDRGDLVAFHAVRAIGGMSVAVTGGVTETPPELLAAADVVLDGPPAVRAWLDGLRERLTGA